MINSKHQIAYNYAMAHIQQSAGIDQLNTALRSLGSDSYLFSLCEPIERAYAELVEELLGSELFQWLMWWMYETDHGTKPMEFFINQYAYNVQDMTLYKFLELVDAP